MGVEDVELGRAIVPDPPGEPGWLGDDGSQAAIGRACELECSLTRIVVYWGVYLKELAAGGEVEDDRIAGAIGEREISWPEISWVETFFVKHHPHQPLGKELDGLGMGEETDHRTSVGIGHVRKVTDVGARIACGGPGRDDHEGEGEGEADNDDRHSEQPLAGRLQELAAGEHQRGGQQQRGGGEEAPERDVQPRWAEQRGAVLKAEGSGPGDDRSPEEHCRGEGGVDAAAEAGAERPQGERKDDTGAKLRQMVPQGQLAIAARQQRAPDDEHRQGAGQREGEGGEELGQPDATAAEGQRKEDGKSAAVGLCAEQSAAGEGRDEKWHRHDREAEDKWEPFEIVAIEIEEPGTREHCIGERDEERHDRGEDQQGSSLAELFDEEGFHVMAPQG